MATKAVHKNKKLSRKMKRKRRQQRMVGVSLLLCMVICLGAFGMIRVSNTRGTEQRDTWIVEGQDVQILPPEAGTLDRGAGMSAQQPDLQRPAPTRAPAATGIPTSVPAATPAPTAEPEPTMPVLAPEPTMEIKPVSITITAVGDCTLGGDVPSGAHTTFDGYVEKYGYDYFFSNVRELFENDDLTIVNLEGPLTTSNDLREGRKFNFRGDPEYVNILSGSSVEIANLANNHAMDFGEDGFTETVEVLEEAGIGASGFSTVYFTEVDGITVCSLGFTEWAYSTEQIERTISLARPNCDLLLVSIHWGREKYHEHSAEQSALGRAMIDAGADVVLGTHSHVYGGFEQYKGKYIVYSLGNFCFGGNRNPSDQNTLIFQQTFNVTPGGDVTDGGISIIPALVSSTATTNDFRPMIVTDNRAASIFAGVSKVSEVSMADVLWMDDSYQVQTGMVTLGR